jgi:hypothetical protein
VIWAQQLFLVPLRALQTPLGRRFSSVALVSALLCAFVGVLYDHPEAVRLPARRAVTVAGATATTRAHPGARVPRPASGPDQTAVAWFARRLGLPASKVRVLQRDSVGADKVRVLVMADAGGGRLDTGLVTVEHTRGGWVVRR